MVIAINGIVFYLLTVPSSPAQATLTTYHTQEERPAPTGQARSKDDILYPVEIAVGKDRC